LKIDHPSFFHSVYSTRDDGGSLPDSVPSSLSRSAGTVSVLPGEPGVSPNDGTPQNNKLVPSSTVGIHRNSSHTKGNELRSGVKTKMASTLQTVRGHGKYRSPIELPTVCRALHVARSCRFGLFLFGPFKNSTGLLLKGMKRKISPSYPRKGKRRVKNLTILSVGQFF